MASWVSSCLSCKSPQTLRRLWKRETAVKDLWRKNLLPVLLGESWDLSRAAGKDSTGHVSSVSPVVVGLLCPCSVVRWLWFGLSRGCQRPQKCWLILIILFWACSMKSCLSDVKSRNYSMWLAFCLLFVGPEPSQCGTLRKHFMAGTVRPGYMMTPLGSTGRTWPGHPASQGGEM